MKPRAFPRSSRLLLAFMTLALHGVSHAAQATYDADTLSAGAQDGSGDGWNTTSSNFWNGSANILWPNTNADEAIFGSGSGAAGSVTVGTVTANKITFATTGSENYTLTGGSITLAGTSPVIAANVEATVASAIAGTAGLTKSGPGTLRLTGPNIYTGTTLLAAGSLLAATTSGNAFNGGVTIGNATAATVLTTSQQNQFASGSNLTFANGTRDAKFQLRGTTQTVAGLDSATSNTLSILQNDESGTAGYVAGGGSGTLIIDNGSASLFDGIIRNGGAGSTGLLNLTKTGDGNLTILNSPTVAGNSYTGVTTVSGGVLQFGNSTATRKGIGSGALQIDTAGTALFWYSNGQTYANPISGTGKLQFRSGNSSTSLGGNEHVITGTSNSGYSGAITVTDSRLRLQTATSPLGNATPGNTVTINGYGQLMYNSAGTYNYNINIGTLGYLEGGAPFIGLPLGALRLELGAVQAGTVTLTGNAGIGSQDTGGTVSGVIGESGGSYGITKLGGNKVTLTANNTYTGITAIQSGTLALQGSIASSAVTLGGSASTGKLALGTGTSASNLTLGSLTSTGLGGGAVGGNPTPSVLTLNLASGTDTINSLGGTGTNENQLSLVKNGAGALVITTESSLTGTTSINAGTLSVPTGFSITGATTVADGAALAITGDATRSWQTTDLIFGSGTTTLTVKNFDANLGTTPIVTSASLAASGRVNIDVDGVFSVGTFPLISYPFGSTIGGTGFGAFRLATLPRGVVASLINDTNNSSVALDIQSINPLKWKGNNVNAAWDINATSNWTLSNVAAKYLDGDLVRFDDSATKSTVNLNATVSPTSVTFENSLKNYTLSGTGGISGTGTLNKSGSGTLTLATANTYSGYTSVSEGVLIFGNGTTDGSITGPLVNNSAVIFNTVGSQSYAGPISGYGEMTKIGTGTQILAGANASNTYFGTFQINAGTIQIGNGTVNGDIGSSTSYQIATGAQLRLNYATAAAPAWERINGSGMFALNSTASGGWGTPAVSPGFTGTLRVEEGRMDLSSGIPALGGVSKIEILAGAQLLAFESTDPYITPIEIAGNGWGETGYPNGLRLAASRTATWAGSVTLTADSGIMAQRLSNFTVTGSITGPFQCEFYAGDPNGDSGTLNVAPAAAVQNSYASTKINGRPNGSTVAGNANAFSTGPLVVADSILKLNGFNFTFANLSGTGGKIGNYNTANPSVITVGSDNTSTTYTGAILDGGTAPFGITKTGNGTLTLGGANSYTGTTTVSQGTLSITSPTLGDTSTVSISSGAHLDLATGTVSDTVGTLILGGVTMLSGTYNSSHPTYGGYFTGTGSLVIAGGYTTWATEEGLDATNNGATQDPDHDGLANLIEFYLDGNPLAADGSALLTQTTDASYLTLTFHRRDDANDDLTSQFAQFGSGLSGWTDVVIGDISSGPDANGVIVNIAGNDTAPDTVVVRIPVANASDRKLFGRLKVVK